MHYATIALSFVQSEAFKKATLRQKGAWLTLFMYCISQENDGIIPNCKTWTDFRCRTILNVQKQTLLTPSPLWRWHSNNLHIVGYPHTSQANLRKKRQEPTALEQSSQYRKFLNRILPLRKKWTLTPLTTEEHLAFQTLFSTLENEITPEKWQLLTDYMASTQKFQKDGKKFYRPYTRKLMAEKFYDVLNHAQLWQRQNRKKATKTSQHPPQQDTQTTTTEKDIPLTHAEQQALAHQFYLQQH